MNRPCRLSFLLVLLVLLAPAARGQSAKDRRDLGVSHAETVAERLVEEGFANVRAVETAEYTVFTLENDYYKIPAEGFARAVQIIEEAGLDSGRAVKIIGTSLKVPEVTITRDLQTGRWHATKRLDASWDAVRGQPLLNDSFGKVDINVYPQVALKNLIITQVYQSLWQISPALEVSLWPGGKLSAQVKIPIVNDGYGVTESLIHPGFVTVSQRFRDPWHLNIFGKVTAGIFNTNRYGGVLELAWWLPNERFWIDSKVGYLDLIRFGYSQEQEDGERMSPPPGVAPGFWMHPNNQFDFHLYWNLALNYYNPSLQTQFLLRAERFLMRDVGFKFEMIRHFRHCSVGFYALKGLDKGAHTNGGFRFQIALPPYRTRRYGYVPRITTSGQMGISYNANNEQVFYKEFRSEASDNIMSKNYYNPYYIEGVLGR